MNFNKNIFVIFISALVAVSCFYYVPFFIQQNNIKAEVKSSIKKEKAEEFIFSEKEFDALTFEGDEEFYLDNKLYDVVRIKKSGGKVRVFALSDEKEKELINEYNELTNSICGAEKKGASPVKTFGKIIALKYLAVNTFDAKPVLTFSVSPSFFESTSFLLNRGYLSAIANPPELV